MSSRPRETRGRIVGKGMNEGEGRRVCVDGRLPTGGFGWRMGRKGRGWKGRDWKLDVGRRW